MRKFIDWLEGWLPNVWGLLLVFTITGCLIGASIWVVQWIVNLLGVL